MPRPAYSGLDRARELACPRWKAQVRVRANHNTGE